MSFELQLDVTTLGSAAEETDVLCHGAHIYAVRGEVPEHLDQRVGEGVEVNVELPICKKC